MWVEEFAMVTGLEVELVPLEGGEIHLLLSKRIALSSALLMLYFQRLLAQAKYLSNIDGVSRWTG